MFSFFDNISAVYPHSGRVSVEGFPELHYVFDFKTRICQVKTVGTTLVLLILLGPSNIRLPHSDIVIDL